MSAVRQVTATWARQLAELLDLRGLPADAVLREVGLARAQITPQDSRIAFAKHVALIEAAAEHLKDPCFGLHFGASLDPLDAGAIGYLAANSPTLGDALKNLTIYLVTSTEGMRARLEPEESQTRLVIEIIDPTVEREQQCYEFALASSLNVCRFILGRRISPNSVELKHLRKTDLDEFRKYFGTQVVFGAGRYAMTLDQSLLAAPCRSADPRLFRIVKSHCDELLKRSRQTRDFREEVECLVGSLLPTGTATISHVASTLGLSERTLSRRLTEQGSNFREIVEEQRRRAAFQYLNDPTIRPTQVAYLLGYSEPSAFSHAFRRWTGQSPVEYRAKSTGSPPPAQ